MLTDIDNHDLHVEVILMVLAFALQIAHLDDVVEVHVQLGQLVYFFLDLLAIILQVLILVVFDVLLHESAVLAH
jgi:hypothetical protein